MAKIKTKKETEKHIENKILDFANRIPGCFVWKNNNVGIFDPVRKIYRKPNSKHIHSGVPDIIGLLNGRFISIEVKTKKGKVSNDQNTFIDTIINNGGFSGIARSLSDAIKMLKRWNNNKGDK